jgi:hypothetical protein
VKTHWTDVATAAALMAAGSVAIYAIIARFVRRTVAKRQEIFDRRLDVLTMTIKALELRVAELSGRDREHGGRADAAAGTGENATGEGSTQAEPETLALITAATTMFLAKKAHVRREGAMPVPDTAGAWAQQGRVIVQTSHNLRPGA